MITRAINGDNEIEIYMVESYSTKKEDNASDMESLQTNKTDFQKTRIHPDPIGNHIITGPTRLNTVWSELVENHVKVNVYNGMSRMTKLEGILELPSYNILKDKVEWFSPKAIFRQFVTQKMLSLTIEGTTNIIMTLDSEVLSHVGKNSLVPVTANLVGNGFGFRNPREPIAMDMKVVETHEINYSGYVYSIEMPKMNNFVCQGILVPGVTYNSK